MYQRPGIYYIYNTKYFISGHLEHLVIKNLCKKTEWLSGFHCSIAVHVMRNPALASLHPIYAWHKMLQVWKSTWVWGTTLQDHEPETHQELIKTKALLAQTQLQEEGKASLHMCPSLAAFPSFQYQLGWVNFSSAPLSGSYIPVGEFCSKLSHCGYLLVSSHQSLPFLFSIYVSFQNTAALSQSKTHQSS